MQNGRFDHFVRFIASLFSDEKILCPDCNSLLERDRGDIWLEGQFITSVYYFYCEKCQEYKR